MNFKDGITIKKHYCISSNCNKEICYTNFLRGSKLCGSCVSKKRFKDKRNHPCFGIKRFDLKRRIINQNKSLKFRKKLSKIKKLLFKDPRNHPSYIDGSSFEEYGAEFDNALKEQVRFRDGYKCQICGCSQLENGKQLDCHHIDYDKKNNILINLIALCHKCHMKTNGNRDYWYVYFRYIMEFNL